MSKQEIKCKWMDTLSMAVERLHMKIDSLEEMRHAFYVTGNAGMEKRIDSLIVILSEIARSVKEARSNALNEVYTMSQQGSANLLNMALAMADKEKEKR